MGRQVVVVVNRQPWDDDIRAQAKALYLADGAALAAEVTQVPIRTIREWARTGNWRQLADQQDSPATALGDGAAAHAKGNGGQPATVPVVPGQELAQDLALAREVYRTQVAKLLDGHGSTSAVRDAAVTLGIMVDKAARSGVPGMAGGEFTWERNCAQVQANMARVREMIAFIAQRARELRGDG
jgi:hypothetical protein